MISQPEVQRQPRVCTGETPQHITDIDFAQRDRCRNPDCPRQPPRLFRNLGQQIVEIIKQGRRLREQGFAARRQPDLARGTLKETYAKTFFQLGNIFGGQPVRYAKLIGRSGKGTGLRRRNKGPQFVYKIHTALHLGITCG